MTPKVNRREALGALGLVGAAAAVTTVGARTAPGQSCRAGTLRQAPGGARANDRAQAVAAALRCEQVRCVFGVPGAQNNEVWDAFKAYGQPYFLVTHEASASVMADAAARVTGEVGVFCVVPGPGLTNAMSGIGEALLDSVPIVGIVTDVNRAPGAPIGQVHGLPNEALLQPVTKAVIRFATRQRSPARSSRHSGSPARASPGPPPC